MKLKFHTLDVFTAEPFTGNGLAVVLDADGLSDQRMQDVERIQSFGNDIRAETGG